MTSRDQQQWNITYAPEFEEWIKAQDLPILEEFRVKVLILKEYGPRLGRPHVDTLNDSKYPNMKELRFSVDNHVVRITFVFDPKRKAVFLTGGEKQGVSQKQFYKDLIKASDKIYKRYLEENYGKEK